MIFGYSRIHYLLNSWAFGSLRSSTLTLFFVYIKAAICNTYLLNNNNEPESELVEGEKTKYEQMTYEQKKKSSRNRKVRVDVEL